MIDAISGRIKRSGGWRVPRVLKIESKYGKGLRADWKQPVYKAPRHGSRGGPRIRIAGAMGYGRLTIKHSRR